MSPISGSSSLSMECRESMIFSRGLILGLGLTHRWCLATGAVWRGCGPACAAARLGDPAAAVGGLKRGLSPDEVADASCPSGVA